MACSEDLPPPCASTIWGGGEDASELNAGYMPFSYIVHGWYSTGHSHLCPLLPRKQAQRGAPAHEIQVSVGFRVSLALPPV